MLSFKLLLFSAQPDVTEFRVVSIVKQNTDILGFSDLLGVFLSKELSDNFHLGSASKIKAGW
jgi:hypothetical protein